jgi:hypothetical protein
MRIRRTSAAPARPGARLIAALTAALALLVAPASFAQRVDPDPDLPPRMLTLEQIAFLFGGPSRLVRPETTLLAWDGVLRPDGEIVYVPGPVFIDWNRKDLTWWFKYSTNAAAVASVQWQIAAYGFPPGVSWTPVPGLDGTGTVSGIQFPIDLDGFAPRPSDWHPTFTLGKPKLNASATPVFPKPVPAPKRDDVVNTSRFAGVKIPPFAKASVEALTAQSPPVIAQPTTLFVRVVPLGFDGTPAGPPSNVVRLDFGDPDPSGVIPAPVFFQPALAFYAYEPVRWFTFDYRCWVVASQDIVSPLTGQVIWAKGERENMCDDDDSILDEIVDAFEGFVEFLTDFVNWVSDTYSNIKGELIAAVASHLPLCGDECKLLIEIGVNAGLAAVGMPPDLPNVKQLQAMGEGYLAETIADTVTQQTGVPVPDEAKEQIKQAVHDMIDQAADLADGGSGSSLWVPDLSRQFQAPIITVNITNPQPLASIPTQLVLQDLDGTRYHPTSFFVPSLDPGQTIRVALTLTPIDDPEAWMALLPTSGDGISEFLAKSIAAENALVAWAAKYRAGDLRVRATFKNAVSTGAGGTLVCTADPTVEGTCTTQFP